MQINLRRTWLRLWYILTLAHIQQSWNDPTLDIFGAARFPCFGQGDFDLCRIELRSEYRRRLRIIRRKERGNIMDGLTPGRVVHYVLDDGDTEHLDGSEPTTVHRPATIVNVEDQGTGTSELSVTLSKGDMQCIVNGSPHLQIDGVRFDANKATGTWHWIEKV